MNPGGNFRNQHDEVEKPLAAIKYKEVKSLPVLIDRTSLTSDPRNPRLGWEPKRRQCVARKGTRAGIPIYGKLGKLNIRVCIPQFWRPEI